MSNMALDREGSVHSKHTDVEKDAAAALDISSEEEYVHQGVKTVEATNKIFGKYSKWALFVGYVSPPTSSETED